MQTFDYTFIETEYLIFSRVFFSQVTLWWMVDYSVKFMPNKLPSLLVQTWRPSLCTAEKKRKNDSRCQYYNFHTCSFRYIVLKWNKGCIITQIHHLCVIYSIIGSSSICMNCICVVLFTYIEIQLLICSSVLNLS